MEIRNAYIKNVSLSMADHGCLTFGIGIDTDHFYTVVGGYMIGRGHLGAKEFDGISKYGLEAIMRIMGTIGVEKWEDLKGKYCRIVDDGWGSKVTKIGHVIKDKWFDIDKFFKEKQNEIQKEKERNS